MQFVVNRIQFTFSVCKPPGIVNVELEDKLHKKLSYRKQVAHKHNNTGWNAVPSAHYYSAYVRACDSPSTQLQY